MARRHAAVLRLCCGLLATAALLAPAVADDELTRDEAKWVKLCIKNLSARSEKVRSGAEAALTRMGTACLETLYDRLGDVKGRSAEAGLGRALAGMGRNDVAAWIEARRGALGSSGSKKLDRIADLLGAAAAPGEPLEVPTSRSPTQALDWRTVPFAAEHPIVDALPASLVGAQPRRATILDGALTLDTDGDGKADKTLPAGGAAVIDVGVGGASRPLLVYAKRDRWYACSASIRTGQVRSIELSLWDADLDGAFGGDRDYVRVGKGAWVRHLGVRHQGTRQSGALRLTLPAGPATCEVQTSGDDVIVSLIPLARPDGVDARRWRALASLNRFRAGVGLPALVADAERTRACTKHAKYLATNAGTYADIKAGGGTHGEHEDRPGYSEEGARAGHSSNISSGDLDGAITRIVRTMLHRILWLSPSSETVGLGYARHGKEAWSVVWCGHGDMREAGAPIPVPAPGQTGVPRFGAAEWPPPDDPPAYYKGKRGFPVSVTYTPQRLTDVSLRLFRDGGSEVAGQMWSTERPIYRAHAGNAGSAFFMPDARLEGATSYWAVFEARRNGHAVHYAWTFTTL